MKLRIVLLAGAIISFSLFTSCKPEESAAPNNAPAASPTVSFQTARALPDNGFKAALTLPEPPAKLRAGQKETISIKVKNTSDVIWWRRGGETTDQTGNKFYIAAGNRWLDKDGKRIEETEGHNGIPKDLKPGEETEMSLEITAPKTPGNYLLSLDMVQEGVSWFSDKGSPVTNIKVMVVK